ncbi:type II toxin-antitoxin system VapC family toxin [Methylobacillus arboreus]|uniref:type II toxin-antitoxin system VapC family toxin n=1 Tax=Methylobacillus arboreus TaxID=755170 RepID=UPI001E4E3EEA|nr:type II toxin-antitoxin system VapC family toxin [Methylobacillus arboreus]MCB5189345.1 type II toxin-antitoxin system VapC family toxin [Methylobacillus arboreus]
MSVTLLDTHALVWLLVGSNRLGKGARGAIQQAVAEDALYISAISPWEISMLVSKERLVLDRDVGEWVHEALALPGIRLEPLSPQVAVASTRLPGDIHSDPADRIIVATARHLGAILVTEDRLLLDYSLAGHLRTLKAGV